MSHVNFPPGYLHYGALSHKLQRESVCVICRKPLSTTTPGQITHPGECARKRKRITQKRWAARGKWKKKSRA